MNSERLREINQRWLATMGMDDESIEARRHARELFQAKLDRLGPRPPWWRMLARGRWNRQYRELNEQLRSVSILGGW